MKKTIHTFPRLFYLVLLFQFFSVQEATAQSLSNYNFAAAGGTFTALAGGTTATLTGTTDEGYFNGINIGFDFWYLGVRNTTISASTNGWITPGSSITNATPVNNLSSGGSPRPVLAPLWDDLDIQSAANVTYQTIGIAGSRIFTLQYLNAKWQNSASGSTISFQVKLYESTGVIQFIYRPETIAVSSGSASIGICATGTGSLNFEALDGTGASPNANFYYETTTLNSKPASGQVYAFTSVLPTAAPTGLAFSSVSGTTATLDWNDNSSNELGFLIYRSTDGTNYSFVLQTAANTTTSIQTGLTPSTTYYWKVFAVTEGALSGAASGTQVTPCTSAAPTVTSPVNYCLNATASALTATGSNLLWGGVAGSVGGTTALTAAVYIDNSFNNKKTNFTTASANVTINTVDYYVPSYQAVSGLVLSLYNSSGTVIATSTTSTTFTAGAATVKIKNTFNYNLATAGNYSIGVSAGSGNIGYDNPSFPITEPTGNISVTGVSVTGYRCFNNIKFTTTSGSTAPVPSTITAGTVIYAVSQTVGGCVSPQVNITVNVSATSAAISQIPVSGIIANYKFNGNANDVSGNNDNGTLQNAPAVGADRFGNAGSAYSFNGSSQYISTATPFNNPGDITISIWFKTSVAGGKLIGFGAQQTGLNNQYDRHIYMNNTGQVYFGVYNTAVYYTNSTLAYNDNNWHLATGTVSSTAGLVLYIDGVQAGTNAAGKAGENYTGYWRIGYDNVNGSWPSQPTNKYFTGQLDDALIYSRALSATEIAALYNSPDGAGNTGPVCIGSPLTLTATTLSGATYAWTGPGSYTSSSQNPSFNYTTANAGTYTLQVTLTGCTATAYTNVVSSTNAGQWSGNTSTAWANAGNWCTGVVPAATTNVTIPNGLTVYPVVSATQAVNNITIQTGASLTVTNAKLQVAGTIVNAGTFDASAGTIEMNGTAAQTIAANSFTNNTLLNLIISNNVTLGGAQNITGTMSFGASSKTLSTGGYLTFKSGAAGTARLADITNAGTISGNTISGNVTIERYIPAKRAWRLLAVPIGATGAPTINTAWQEGVTSGNPNPGYGTQIVSGTTANGFDQGINKNPSMKIYSNSTNAFVGLPLSPGTNTAITSYPGYFLFIRGSRSTNLLQGVNAALSNTTLRMTGLVNTNNIVSTISAAGFTLVGNPYPAAIDFHSLTKSNVIDLMYLWDPKIGSGNGVGGYVTFIYNPALGSYITTTSVSPVSQYIQSGEAFFVKSLNGLSTGTLTVKETDKNTGGSDNTFRVAGNGAIIRTNLMSIDTLGNSFFTDGVVTSYDDGNSNAVDMYDAPKLYNIKENIGIARDGKMLSIESRHTIEGNDTTFFKMYNLKTGTYELQIIPGGMDNTGLYALVKDKYAAATNNSLVSMTDTTNVLFRVTADSLSFQPDRFSIVFGKLSSIPAQPIILKAFAQQKDIAVNWQALGETDIRNYEVETSGNGISFTTATQVGAKLNNRTNVEYTWLDIDAAAGTHYYRIKATGFTGRESFSPVVKVIIDKAHPLNNITVYPNVIKGNTITFQLNNIDKGTYSLQLYSIHGQLIKTISVDHDGSNSSVHSFPVSNALPAGKYQLYLTSKAITLSTPILKE